MEFRSGAAGGRIANTIILPMIGVVLLAMASVVGLLFWTAHVADSEAEANQKDLLHGAVGIKLDQLAHLQESVVIWDEAYFKTNRRPADMTWLRANLGAWSARNFGHSRSAIIANDGTLLFQFDQEGMANWVDAELEETIHGAVMRVRARYIMSFQRLPSGLFKFDPVLPEFAGSIHETGAVSINGQPYLFSAAAVTQELHTISGARKAPAVMVSFEPVTQTTLQQLSSLSGLQEIMVTAEPMDRDGYTLTPLRAPNGKIAAYLHWQPDRPGTAMLLQVAPVLLILGIAFVALVIVVMNFTRHMARELADSEQQAVHTARHDSLTGLPNRDHYYRFLAKALGSARQHQRSVAVVYIDLDHFKDINDTLGHAAGDNVLKAASARLKEVVPASGMLARISGDEFAMVLPNCAARDDIERILKAAQDRFARPVPVSGRELYVSLSMGSAVAPQDGEEQGELLRKADIALYDAKENGRGRWAFFDPIMEAHVQTKDQISRELRKAIDSDALDIAYQPQADLSASRITAVEALARWTHPEFGPISPASFIPIAEDTGLINDLGFWILRRALRDSHRWPEVTMSVNVSPTQFKHPRFVETVTTILDDNQVSPSRLEIEVTESVFTAKDSAILETLSRLREIGVRVALDDFGSGYSSLGYLRRFPFDTLKVDRSFVSAIGASKEADALLETIVHMGRALGMDVVAEGIETEAQLEYLQGIGADRLQGFYLARPSSLADTDRIISNFGNPPQNSEREPQVLAG